MFGVDNNKAQSQIAEVVEKLKTEAGLSDAQANKAIDVIKNFVVEKYPMLQGAVNNIFGNK